MFMVTIKEVAKRAGVSTSTVSRTLSGNIFVNKDTKKKVIKAVNELGYSPNVLAKGLKEGKTNTIGLIIPNIKNPIFPAIVKGVEETARKNGFIIILCNTDENIDNEKEIINTLEKRWVDGFIFATASSDLNHICKIKEDKFPLVLLVRSGEDKFDSVVTNNFEASYKAVRYLIQRGHKKIAIINGDINLSLYRERYEGYKKALLDSGLEIPSEMSFCCSFENKECYIKTTDLLKSNIIPDAIFATNDLRAIEAIRAIKDLGLKVPEDISVLGFDNIQISSFIDPTLTTVSQPFYKMGEVAVKKLIKIISYKRNRKPKKDVIKSELVIRNSTR